VTADEIERWSPLKVWVYSLFSRNPKSNRSAVDLANLGKEDRFLDIGCGPGAALEYAFETGAEVVGVDPSPAMVARAQRRVPGVEVRVGSAEQLPFPDGHFTVVINVLSFHHWADREAGLREILRVLAPGGRLHVVEGALRDGKDGHGLNRTDAELLTNRLLELGYAETATSEITPGRRSRYVVVTGVAPVGA
jgi:ubiquinone/menaquinone biosynthesis C-methylase UbiE